MAISGSSNVTNHTWTSSYTSDTSVELYIRCNDSMNNAMNYSNYTSFVVDISAATVAAASSGGGGAASTVTADTNVASSNSKMWSSVTAGETILFEYTDE